MDKLHSNLHLYMFPVSELQTENPFLMGFDLCHSDGRVELEITLAFIGDDGDDQNDDGITIETFYLEPPQSSDLNLEYIFGMWNSPKTLRELFNDLDELNELEQYLLPKIRAVVDGELMLTEWDCEEMRRSIETETEIDLSEICETDCLPSLFVFITQ